MSSGVAVADDVVTTYNELKTGRKHKYILYRLNADANFFSSHVYVLLFPNGFCDAGQC